jgi:queuine tRNA-ribosyltransferase
LQPFTKLNLKFNILQSDTQSDARAGEVITDHGVIETPIFMPVGTIGTVKAVAQKDLQEQVQAQIILGNTYHLYLRPGTDTLQKAGGLHRFMHWDQPILTDSGGYQVFSLAHRRKITEEGARFASHIDGSYHMFSPEKVMEIERIIGADIIMAFDECPPYPCDEKYATNSMHLTHRWLDRCFNYLESHPELYGYRQSLFPIVQGSTYHHLRQQSAEYIASKGAEGNAIGGLSVGEPADKMYEMVALVNQILPKDKPRYLMGVGTPVNILENIALGVDMFDCVMPTRNARHGLLYTSQGIINIKNEKWKNDFSALDEYGTADVDNYYNKAYLRHLFHADEMLGMTIASIHNLAFYLWLVKTARKHILMGDFLTWKTHIVPILGTRL